MPPGAGPRQGCRSRMDHASIARLVGSGARGARPRHGFPTPSWSEAITDLAVVRQQPGLFGPVASDPTAWRVLDGIDTAALARLRAARADARELAWFQLL